MGETDKAPITLCTKADYDQIITHLTDFWPAGSLPVVEPLHHPMWIYEFGDSAFVIKKNEEVVAYYFGFIAQTGPVAYGHLGAVRKTDRRKGHTRRLLDRFLEYARSKKCKEYKATTHPTNKASIAFNRSMGMEMLGEPNSEGVPVVKDYLGPGKDSVVFRMLLDK